MAKKSKKSQDNCFVKIWNSLREQFRWILYGGMLSALWIYLICNWEQCISMQFFSKFDGNNILFLVGILLIILPFYEVEGNGIKIQRAGEKKLEKDLNEAEAEYKKSQIQNIIVMQSQGEPGQKESKKR